MRLFVYSREKCLLGVAKGGQRSIRMDRNGCIFLSSPLIAELGLQEGSKVVLVGDEDDPKQWFLCIVDDEGGFSLKLKRRNRKNNKGLTEIYCYGAGFNCSYLCHKVLDNIGTDKPSATFMVVTTPIEMEGMKLYKMLTSNPIIGPDRKYIPKKDKAKMEV